MSEQLKSVMKRVSARFSTEVENIGAKRNRTFVGQADHLLDVYLLVTQSFGHDDLDTMRMDLDAAMHLPHLKAVAEARAKYKAKHE